MKTDQILDRAQNGWGLHRYPYSQTTLVPPGYRADCSGYVSMVLGLPTRSVYGYGGYTTVTLVTSGVLIPIETDTLRSGDFVGMCGEGTEGDVGHITIFDRWQDQDPNNSDFVGWEQSGGIVGPRYGDIHWYPGYRGYRAKEDEVAEVGKLFLDSNGTVYLSNGLHYRVVIRAELDQLRSLCGDPIPWDGTIQLGTPVVQTLNYDLLAQALLRRLAG